MDPVEKTAFSFWRRKRYLVITAFGTFVVGLATGGASLYVFYKFRRAEILPTVVHDNTGKYIYVPKESQRPEMPRAISVRVEKFRPEIFRPANLLQSTIDPQWRRQLIEEMTFHQWTDSEAYRISQKAFASPEIMVAIARSQNFNPKLLFKPPRLRHVYLKPSIKDELVRILTACPAGNLYSKLGRRRDKVLNLARKKEGLLSAFGVVNLVGPPADIQVIRALLNGLSEFSEDAKCGAVLRESGIIRVLHRIASEFITGLTVEDYRYVSRILANVSAYALSEDLVEEVSKSALLPLLAKWSSSPDLDLSLRAAKTLANLDLDPTPNQHVLFTSGVYLLHPLRRQRQDAVFDVVFVHGLRGSVLKTWRQNVRSLKELDHKEITVNEPYLYTQCWPKDWLSLDFPSSRIVAVDYETSFIQSTFLVPSENLPEANEGILKLRSIDMLQKLKLAGLGKRPILWISHSMGGILVKQMLLLNSLEANSSIVDMTVGCVFYSTPHTGSPFADQMARYFRVSPEVQDLRINNPYLLQLQDSFLNLVAEKKYSLLSFGETLPDYRIITTRVVPIESSNPRVGKFVRLDDVTHLASCKPTNPRSAMYLELVSFIRETLVKSTDRDRSKQAQPNT